VAGNEDELHLRRQADIVHGADEIGGEDERALQDRDDQKVVVVLPGDFLGQFQVAPGDGRCRKQNLDLLAAHDWPGQPLRIVAYSANATETVLTPFLGTSSRLEKANLSPGASAWPAVPSV